MVRVAFRPSATLFLLFSQKKLEERKGYPVAAFILRVFHPFREACVTRPSKPHSSWLAAELERYAPLNPKWFHMLGAAKGIRKPSGCHQSRLLVTLCCQSIVGDYVIPAKAGIQCGYMRRALVLIAPSHADN